MMRSLPVTAILVLCACTTAPTEQQAQKPAPAVQTSAGSSPLERARIHTELGVSYYESGRLAVALEELNEAIRADKTYAPAWNARALVHMELGEWGPAESDFKQALRVDPNNSDSKNNYGLFLCQRNRPKEGMRYFLEAVKNPLYNTPDVAYKNAGLCARQAGELQAAEQYFQRAVRINPSQPQSLYNLAELAYGRSDVQAAKGYLDRYMRVAPAPGPEQLWLGVQVERAFGDRNAMLAYGNQLRRRFPGSPETKAFLQSYVQ
jgi:type IV pilus assembly protein PilF